MDTRSSLPEPQGWESRTKCGNSDRFGIPVGQMDIANVGTLGRDGFALADTNWIPDNSTQVHYMIHPSIQTLHLKYSTFCLQDTAWLSKGVSKLTHVCRKVLPVELHLCELSS